MINLDIFYTETIDQCFKSQGEIMTLPIMQKQNKIVICRKKWQTESRLNVNRFNDWQN